MNRDVAQIRHDLEELIKTAEAMKNANAARETASRDLKNQQLAALEQQLERTKKVLSGEMPAAKKTLGQRIKSYLEF